jgi:hypothetical protein
MTVYILGVCTAQRNFEKKCVSEKLTLGAFRASPSGATLGHNSVCSFKYFAFLAHNNWPKKRRKVFITLRRNCVEKFLLIFFDCM